MFTKTIQCIDFSFEKKELKNDEFIFLVQSSSLSFFMSKMSDGIWQVLYTSCLHDVLHIEHELRATLTENGY